LKRESPVKAFQPGKLSCFLRQKRLMKEVTVTRKFLFRDSHEAFQHMVDFTQRVKDTRLKGKLESALGGRGSFHRFRDALKEYPEVEKEWFKFKSARDKEEVKEWLESIGIEMEGVKKESNQKGYLRKV
jgi:hypothetical protein